MGKINILNEVGLPLNTAWTPESVKVYILETGVTIEFNLDDSDFCNLFKNDLLTNPEYSKISFIKNKPLNVYLSNQHGYIIITIEDNNIIDKICSEGVSFGIMDYNGNFVCHLI